MHFHMQNVGTLHRLQLHHIDRLKVPRQLNWGPTTGNAMEFQGVVDQTEHTTLRARLFLEIRSTRSGMARLATPLLEKSKLDGIDKSLQNVFRSHVLLVASS